MAPDRVLVLRFSLPRSARPSDIVGWIAQMLTTHSGAKVTIEPGRQEDGRPTFQVISTEEDAADLLRLAWRDNHSDWRTTGAEIVH